MSYTKHNFEAGDVILAAPFNEMEDQIATNEQVVSGISQDYAALTEDVADLKSAIELISEQTNLFKPETIRSNKRLDSEGSLASSDGYYASDFIPVIAGQYYEKNSPVNDAFHRLAVYSSASDTSMISGQLFSENIVKIHADGKYIRICGLLEEVSTADVKIISAHDAIARIAADAVDDKIDTVATFGNLFDPSTIKANMRIVSDGAITTAEGYYTSAFIPVLPGCHVTKNSPIIDTYHRLAIYKTANAADMIPGELYAQNEITIPPEGRYVRFCGLLTEVSTASVTQITAIDDNARYLGNTALSQSAQLQGLLGSDGIRSSAASVTGGNSIAITTFPKYLKKDTFVSFYGKFSTFSGLLVGKGYTTYRGDWVEITAQDVVFHHYESNTDNVMQSDAHGLTIADYIMVTLFLDASEKLICSVNSKTGTFTTYIQTGIYSEVIHTYHEAFAGDTFATPTADMTDVDLCVSNGDTRCPVWCIGDSYFGISAERVLGQLRALGFWDGVLFDGLAGLNSQNGYEELTKLLAFGKPKILVWYLGMNDSNAAYLQYMTQVKAYCDENNITLILNKVPTVPTVDNETKDGYVVASGCRYINSYLAVGANSSGEWYAGFLSSDNIHPTSTGAKALAMRMLIDVPELAEYGYTAAIT